MLLIWFVSVGCSFIFSIHWLTQVSWQKLKARSAWFWIATRKVSRKCHLVVTSSIYLTSVENNLKEIYWVDDYKNYILHTYYNFNITLCFQRHVSTYSIISTCMMYHCVWLWGIECSGRTLVWGKLCHNIHYLNTIAHPGLLNRHKQ